MSDTTADALLRASPLDPVDARVLLAHALGWTRTQLITRGDAPLDDAAVERFRALEARRVAGEPVAQLVGMREFFGRPFDVTPDVLIPRPETELLVEATLDAIGGLPHAAVLDLGTGSGAIAVSIAAERPDARVWALDRSPAALAVAQRNADKLLDARRPGGPLHWLQSDWYAALDPALAFDTIVSNPPYICLLYTSQPSSMNCFVNTDVGVPQGSQQHPAMQIRMPFHYLFLRTRHRSEDQQFNLLIVRTKLSCFTY
ncbi:N5-glutamine S-adenosyl-L-methionine-dependent methyltransferase [Burkholderia sola]|nr:N5-glutamine S-adenosyl-L-methionine-dependent methyltransferase [Burkholderia cenocepacia]